MAPRKRAAEAAEEEPQLAGLSFDEPLSWRAGKAIQTTELLRRLDTLSKELRDMDQELSDKDSLTSVAKELAGQNLLGHKDRGVRAFTACCLVDVLKICAPDAPFTPSQLNAIFTLFITDTLPALSDPSNAYNTQHMYVLASLAEVKSIVLLTDLQNYQVLLKHLITTFFDIISGSSKSSTGEQVSKNVEINMTSILVTLVDEAPSMPDEAIDIIVAQFLRANSVAGGTIKQNGDSKGAEKQSTLLLKDVPAAYTMAAFLCNSCPEKMARYISQYFNQVIVDASGSNVSLSKDSRRSNVNADSDEEDGQAGPTEADLKELNKAHRLLRELWRASPPVLQNVIPQLEAELSAENAQLRLLATETLGDIISGIGAAGPPPPPTMDPAAYPPLKLSEHSESPVSDSVLTTPNSPLSFIQTHSTVYHSFLGRKNDKSAVIRSGWTTAIGRVLVTSAGGIGLSRDEETVLVNGLAEKLNDVDERVRIAAIRAVAGFSCRDVMTKLAINGDINKSGSILSSLADRVRDRKHAVRVEGMTTIAKIWGVAAGEIAAGNESVISLLGSIPSKIMDALYTNDLEVNVLLDHVMFEQLLPLGYPPSKGKSKRSNGESQDASQTNGDEPFDPDKVRVKRILTLIKSLDARSRKAFFALQSRQSKLREGMTGFLKRCEDYNGGVMDADEKETKDKLAAVIQWLVSMLPDPLRVTADLWKYAKVHDRRSYQLIRFMMAAESDFKTVHNAIKEFSKRIEAAPGAPAGILDSLTPLIYRSASLVYNQSHLHPILEYSRNDDQGLGATAHEVLKEISERNPEVFKAHVKGLCKLLEEEAPSPIKENEIDSVKTLKACAGYARKYPEEIPHNRKFVQALMSYAQYGTPPESAKHAVSILVTAIPHKDANAQDLLQKVTTDWEYGTDHFITKLGTMSQLALLSPTITNNFNDELLSITTQQILLQVRTEATENDRSWQDDSALDEECQAKCWALKLLVNRLRAPTDPESVKAIGAPVFKLLNTLIAKDGEVSKTQTTPKHHRSRLRLLAAQLLLKLCKNRVFDEMLLPADFIRLATVAQDSLYQVRRGFIDKLQKYIVQGLLPSRFHTIVFLVAFEPEMKFRQITATWIRSRAKVYHEKKSFVLEATLPRLLSLLAHHPDYSSEPTDLTDTAQYILFYVTTVADQENIGLIFKYAQLVKQARDALNIAGSDNLYILSDLTQAVIRIWDERKGWNMQSYSGKVGLPKDLFGKMPNHEVAQETAAKNFLPDKMDDLLDGLIKSADKKTKRKSEVEVSHPAKKPRTASTSKPIKDKPLAIRKDKPASKSPKNPSGTLKKSKSGVTPSSTMSESQVARRRSGRGAGAKSYADRDDSEDDKEMLNGVSEWEYGDGHIENVEEDTGGEEAEEVADVEEDEVINEEEEAEPTPAPASSPRAAKTSGKKERETQVAKAKVEKPKPKPKVAVRERAAAKENIKPAPFGKGKGKGKAKGLQKERDVFDIESD